MVIELGEDDGVRVLGLRGRVGVDEEVLVVARDGDVPAVELLREVGAERAEPVLEELGELLRVRSSASSTRTLQSSATPAG